MPPAKSLGLSQETFPLARYARREHSGLREPHPQRSKSSRGALEVRYHEVRYGQSSGLKMGPDGCDDTVIKADDAANGKTEIWSETSILVQKRQSGGCRNSKRWFCHDDIVTGTPGVNAPGVSRLRPAKIMRQAARPHSQHSPMPPQAPSQSTQSPPASPRLYAAA